MWLPNILLCGIIVSWVEGQIGDTYPAHEYEYSLRRDYLLEKEQEMENNPISLTQDEMIVDNYLQYLKAQHFEETKANGFPPLRPIEEVLDIILDSEVYRILTKLPKGGNMHAHENHQLSKRTLMDLVWASPDFQYLYILPEDHPETPWTLNFFVNAPVGEGWIQVEGNPNYTKEVVLQNQHLLGILTDHAKRYPSDSRIRWSEMNQIWGRGSSQLIANINIKRDHMRLLYEEALSEAVQFLETRRSFATTERIYELSTDPEFIPTFGKKYLDTEGELDVNITLDIVSEFMRNHSEFIGHRRIVQDRRVSDKEDIANGMQKAIALYQKYPDHVKGYDLVAEEDAGHSTLFYLENYLELYDSDTEKSKIPLYLHTVETSFPKDLITSELVGDPVSTGQNAYDSVVLGAKRIGHGLGYIKFPYLLQEIKQRGVAIEVCPVSNQLLGLQPDIRNHPAINYMKMGIPIILGADDPGSFGYDHFTVDWYEAFMAWGLTLKELKQMSVNALNYSSLTEVEKQDAITNKFEPYWNEYIQTIKTEACGVPLETETPVFYRILPRDGAITGTTKVHVFGRNFERAVCNTIRCYFGPTEATSVYYVNNNHMICLSPEGSGTESSVNLTISFDDGQTFYETGENFTYKFPHESLPFIVESRADTETISHINNASNIKFGHISTFIIFVLSIVCIF